MNGLILLLAASFTVLTTARDGQASWHYAAGDAPILACSDTPDPEHTYRTIQQAPLATASVKLARGTYHAHVLMRGFGQHSDSVALLVDGAPAEANYWRLTRPSWGITGTEYGGGTWRWYDTHQPSGSRVTIVAKRSGYHAISLACREPGVQVAAVVLIPVGGR